MPAPNLPAKLTPDRLLKFLLGAPPAHRLPWWDGVELVVPEGAAPVWMRVAITGVPTNMQEAATALRAAASDVSGPVQLVALNGGAVYVLEDPYGPLPDDPRLPPGTVLHDAQTGMAPNLNDHAVVTYTQLFDLRHVVHPNARRVASPCGSPRSMHG